MTQEQTAEIKAGFDQVIKSAPLTAEQIAQVEILREYFTNPDFKSWMHDAVYQNRQA